jgi:hypothetical protein
MHCCVASAGKDHGPRQIKFCGDAETVLERLPQRGVAMILKAGGRASPSHIYERHEMARLVRTLRGDVGLPMGFTPDTGRNG